MKKFIFVIFYIVFFVPKVFFASDKINIAFTDDGLFQYFNFEDGKSSLKTWIEDVAQKKGIEVEVDYIRNTEDAYKKFINNEIQVLTLGNDFFFKHSNELQKISKDFWSISFVQDDGEKYCLFANKQEKVKSFKDIKDKSILLLENTMFWLKTKVLEYNKREPKEILKDIKFVKKDSTILLNLYFNQSNLGVASKNSWDTMRELNPKMASKIEVIECSDIFFPPFIGILRDNIPKKFKKIFFTTIFNAKNEQNSNVLFSVIPLSHFYTIGYKKMQKMKSFFGTYNKLKAKYKIDTK